MAEMSKEAIEARRAYKREWYKKNKERVKAYNMAYWLKRAEEYRAEQERKEADEKEG